VARFTTGPAKLLRLSKGTLSIGADADVTVFDPQRHWVFEPASSASKSKNSPFHGWPLMGKAVATVVGGKVVWQQDE
jgi:dihydroorotase